VNGGDEATRPRSGVHLLRVSSWSDPRRGHTDPAAPSRTDNGPALLWHLFQTGGLALDVRQEVAHEVWQDADHPMSIGEAPWRQIFSFIGYTEAGKAAPRPTDAVTLFRGSTAAHRRGWSWTRNERDADRFACHNIRGRPTGEMWEACVQPWRLFASIGDGEEGEFIVDTKSLKIVRWVLPGR
jgi:hypothetical protein